MNYVDNDSPKDMTMKMLLSILFTNLVFSKKMAVKVIYL